MQEEIEYKFIIQSKDAVRERLAQLGAHKVYPEKLMRMQLFDYANKQEMNKKGQYKWWRVRDEGHRITVTLKEIFDDGETRDDHTKELEIEVNDYDKACQMLIETGLVQTVDQEKYREQWQIDGIEVTLDTWPALPTFIEIEGKNETEMRTLATKLGLNMQKVILGSVDYVYERVYNVTPDAIGTFREFKFANQHQLKRQLEELGSKVSAK